MTDIFFMFYLGEVHTMVRIETVKTESHIVSTICCFEGRILCIVISMQPPLRFRF